VSVVAVDHVLPPAIRPRADRCRFILYDQRGSFRTPVLPPAKISFKALVEDLEQLRQRLGLGVSRLLIAFVVEKGMLPFGVAA
jgi:pimeloyl-ACP methyl ester carboxylesterase